VAWIEKHFGKDAEIVISEQRYGYIRGAVKESTQIVRKPDFSITEAIDRIIMNRFLALPIFVFVLWEVFQLTFLLGQYPMTWLESLFGLLSGGILNIMPDTLLRSLLVDGVIGGVGGGLSFIPLIVILFFLLSILEDVGYMSRAAFATDKLLHSFGLHGQSIFPMMLGFGCSVPAIMASRTLKSPRDRIITILITPMMSCGAKIPVHVMLAAAFFPDHAPGMVMLIYAIGVVLSLCCAFILKRIVLKGDPTLFVMELPPYRSPTLRGILWHVWEKTWLYVKKVGTIILASAILIWAVTSFPAYEPPASTSGGAEDLATNMERALKHSYAGRLGEFIVPIFRPMGFGWKLAAASVTGFAAKEVIVSTLGILYPVGAEETEESDALRNAHTGRPGHEPPLSFCVHALHPDHPALATIRAEIGWKWLGFELVFLLGLGWVICTLVYQIGILTGFGTL
jgi:ferrous iron transport protein B